MTAENDLVRDIAKLVEPFAHKSATANTRLYSDLGLTGDDADALMKAFVVKYDVDMSNFVWLRYFEDEPTLNDLMGPAMALAASVLSPSFAVRWQAARNAEREITIAHLAAVAAAKTWIEPGDDFRRRQRASALLPLFSAASVLVMAFFALLGPMVIYVFLTGGLGERNALALIGILAVSILPFFLAFTSWRAIRRKLASA